MSREKQFTGGWLCETGDKIILDEQHIIPSIRITYSRHEITRITEVQSRDTSKTKREFLVQYLLKGEDTISSMHQEVTLKFSWVTYSAEPTHL